ncbi:uroporphyrinogen-III C-methyltransferase [uncultured Arcticibacterium sp.]|uniref:uroporphyrinogen-III C-methyltransferase n=1 Tax=uncultured Arcticibacterium sp. TaxID=2173042 RepID=UPI0030F8DD96
MKLSLIGAGPGDPDLITLKAIKTLAAADVILYDALANPCLLSYASKEAELVYVGKRLGQHSVSQDEINRIILQNTLAGKHVARLKGGDPVIFGRGFEEMDYVSAYGVETEIIPGISSSVAVPSLKGIPVTKRGMAESFWVITGHTKDRKLPKDMKLAAQSSATIVILMGISKIEEIMEIFSANGKKATPVAIIQNGTTPEEKTITGEVFNIAEKAKTNNIQSPAIIVIGETVRLCPDYINSYLATNHLVENEKQAKHG